MNYVHLQNRGHSSKSVLYKTCTLHMWLWRKWHCELVHGCMCTQNVRRDGSSSMCHQPCRQQRCSHLGEYLNRLRKASHSFQVYFGYSTVGLLRSGEHYSCHCEALGAHLEARHSTSVPMKNTKFLYTFTPNYLHASMARTTIRAQELCESRGGHPGLPSLISLQFLWT